MKFGLGVLGMIILFYLVTLLPFFQAYIFPAILNVNASIAGVMLNLIGQGVTVSGASVTNEVFSLSVAQGCDALEPIALFISVVIAFPETRRHKIRGILVGTLVLFAINQIRIISLFFVGAYAPGAFHVMHVDVWQVAFIILALLC